MLRVSRLEIEENEHRQTKVMRRFCYMMPCFFWIQSVDNLCAVLCSFMSDMVMSNAEAPQLGVLSSAEILR